ncbi:hypothetical protein, partial [Chryseobacterium sp.]|uniref:hypothetical protein n=1 Tax=Chryseobacterium sp. TaxID=1871047 RepID=UPI002FC9C71A
GQLFRPPFSIFFALVFPATKKDFHSGRAAIILRFKMYGLIIISTYHFTVAMELKILLANQAN